MMVMVMVMVVVKVMVMVMVMMMMMKVMVEPTTVLLCFFVFFEFETHSCVSCSDDETAEVVNDWDQLQTRSNPGSHVDYSRSGWFIISPSQRSCG